MLKFAKPPPCTTQPDVFFPDKGHSPQAAKALCRECPMRTACLAEAMRLGYELAGVWGGTTNEERRKLRRGIRVS